MEKNSKYVLKPQRLIPGDNIGVVAPAGPFDIEKFESGIKILESFGFSIIIPDDLFKKKGYLAGSDTHRAGIVNRLFSDSTIKGIICARGGFGSLRVLQFIDYESIKKNPKIFIGFSDITAVLTALYARCRLVTFHGPMVTTLKNADKKTTGSMISTLSSGTIMEIIPKKGSIIKSGIASGKLLGGNIATLCHLIGTPFAPELKGNILFLEETGEQAYRIDRMLIHMKLAGWFDGLAGLALGSFDNCGGIGEIVRIVEDIFFDINIPILGGFEIGHGKRNLTIPLGIDATLDADSGVLFFHEAATR